MTVTLHTQRLTLRLPQDSDWPFYRAYRMSARSTLNTDDKILAGTLFAALCGHWTLRGFGRFIAQDRESGRPIGHFGPLRPAGYPENELTWTLWDPAFEGRGLAQEAVLPTRKHAFTKLRWTTAVSYIDPANDRSQALAARLGARRDSLAAVPQGETIQVWRHPIEEALA